jgi:hypothetical protein
MLTPEECLRRPADDVRILAALEQFVDLQLKMRFRAPGDEVEVRMPQEMLPAHEQALIATYSPRWEVTPYQRNGWACLHFRRRA